MKNALCNASSAGPKKKIEGARRNSVMNESNDEKESKPKRIEIDAIDWVAFAGLASLIGGIAWIYKPAALIVLGAILIFYAFAVAKDPAPPPEQPRRTTVIE